jgi:hypothetical protein
MGYDAEYWQWDPDIREVYEERISIMCDGGNLTRFIDYVARQEARGAHISKVSEEASNPAWTRFGIGR